MDNEIVFVHFTEQTIDVVRMQNGERADDAKIAITLNPWEGTMNSGTPVRVQANPADHSTLTVHLGVRTIECKYRAPEGKQPHYMGAIRQRPAIIDMAEALRRQAAAQKSTPAQPTKTRIFQVPETDEIPF